MINWEKLENEWLKRLLADARGNVLELGVGTGYNFKYYPAGVSVTATDMSARVIEKAGAEAKARGISATFIVSSPDELHPGQQDFDTIVSTFSLCAYNNPAKVLQQVSKWCKQDGTILLLEYGLSKFQLISWLQRKWERYHYRRTGYHLDRDMLGLISNSNLRLKKIEVKYAGIVYLVWASLKPVAGENQETILENKGDG